MDTSNFREILLDEPKIILQMLSVPLAAVISGVKLCGG